ncbi:hypothetical protein MLD38_031900 [Melastoma candidum]|uniref:Uncharacterized protein n=1 Tax=Melastoma candidum TaxID=119954 RepID=A0ACB9MS88_9MYRT|nr:hypothetical protein MLD38_031900 [Melastoma candidum]
MVSVRPVQMKRVCVIGAGPAGLVAARELRKEGHDVVVFEQNHDVGGQWLYQPNTEGEDLLGRSEDGFLRVHSSMYASLRLRSSREIMGYTDFPFLVRKNRDPRRFPGHEELYLYLRDFAEHFRLREMIRFSTRVEYVGMVNYGDPVNDLKWTVRSREKGVGKAAEEVFNAVVVATGHYSHPSVPSIKGMDSWKGKQLHSHVYRVPESFRGEKVVILGKEHSAQDIGMELVKFSKEVHFSVRSNEISGGLAKLISKHENMRLHPKIDSLEEDGRVLFEDGTTIKADTILYCTGYRYAFPFLDTKGIVTVDDGRVGPLYEHTFPPLLSPSLSFSGIPRKIVACPFFEAQARWIAQLLSGKRTLPPPNEMMRSIKEFYESRDATGLPKEYTHDIADFEYCDNYAARVGFPPLEGWKKELCVSAIIKSEADLETFRDTWDENDEEQLRQAFDSPHFKQLGPLDFSLNAYRPTQDLVQ